MLLVSNANGNVPSMYVEEDDPPFDIANCTSCVACTSWTMTGGGIVCLYCINLSNDDFVVTHSERIAQLVIAKHEQPELIEVNELSDTVRGAGGFGSTGTK